MLSVPWAYRLITGLAQQTEHILLVGFDTGLVEGIDTGDIGGNAAAELEEVDHFADIFFINATSFVTRQRTQSTLTESAIKEIANLYHNREEVEEISKSVSFDEIKANRYNLMVERYVTQKQIQEVFDLQA